jgi:hypothetical protein
MVRPKPVYDHAPHKRQRDEHTAIGSVHPPELGDGLKGHHPVNREDQRPEQRPGEGLMVAHPSPHEVSAPDLAEAR